MMNNQKLTRKELHSGYIQQYVIGDYRIMLRRSIRTDISYTVELEEMFTSRDSNYLFSHEYKLTDARKEFARQVSEAKKLMRKEK